MNIAATTHPMPNHSRRSRQRTARNRRRARGCALTEDIGTPSPTRHAASQSLSTGIPIPEEDCDHGAMTDRFLTLADVSETLNVSPTQTYALVRSGELPAIKIGGRGQWRVEATELEAYIDRQYEMTRDFVRTHPFIRAEVPESSSPTSRHA
jgi:excisionase family DNA binding protein